MHAIRPGPGWAILSVPLVMLIPKLLTIWPNRGWAVIPMPLTMIIPDLHAIGHN
jgi:hypothetical protein